MKLEPSPSAFSKIILHGTLKLLRPPERNSHAGSSHYQVADVFLHANGLARFSLSFHFQFHCSLGLIVGTFAVFLYCKSVHKLQLKLPAEGFQFVSFLSPATLEARKSVFGIFFHFRLWSSMQEIYCSNFTDCTSRLTQIDKVPRKRLE